MSHKAYCNCPRCCEAKEVLNKGKSNRVLPWFIRKEIAEKNAKEEEMMLWKGYIKMRCPACEHYSYMKIGPVMTCTCCCHKIQNEVKGEVQ